MMTRVRITYLITILASFLVSGCATPQIDLGTWHDDSFPASFSTFPENISTGDILEIRFFLNTEVDPSPYTLGIEDTITIEVHDHPDLTSSQIKVLSDGSISALAVGTIHAAGKVVEDLSVELEQRYRKIGIRNPVVTITVHQDQQRLRTLLGSSTDRENGNLVAMPVYAGVPFELPFIEPVAVDRPIEAIRQEVRQKYRESFGRQLEVTLNLREREVPVITVTGEVMLPGRITATRPMTPFSAVAAAGGFTDAADPERVAVVRFRRDGNYSRWMFDLQNALADPSSPQHNFQLSYEDIVVVVKSEVADANIWIDQYIRRMIPITIGVGIPID